MLTGSDLPSSEPIAHSGPAILRIRFIGISWNVGRLLPGFSIGAPFSIRFQIEATHEGAGLVELSPTAATVAGPQPIANSRPTIRRVDFERGVWNVGGL